MLDTSIAVKEKQRERRKKIANDLTLPPQVSYCCIVMLIQRIFLHLCAHHSENIVEHEMTHREPLAKPRQGAMQGRLALRALNIPPDLWRIYA